MSFLELAKKRFSVRSFKDIPVEEEKILQVLEAGRIAPSAKNIQPWHFIVAKENSTKMKISSAYNRPWLQKAPAIIVICVNLNVSWLREDGKNHGDIDGAIAADHMSLMAVDLGLGSCWVCNFQKDELVKALNLPEGIEPVVIFPLGYPKDEPNTERHSALRKELKLILHYEKF